MRSPSGESRIAVAGMQNALVAQNAEHYYRVMIGSGPASWNVRDRHKGETLDRLLAFYGPDSRASACAAGSTATTESVRSSTSLASYQPAGLTYQPSRSSSDRR